MSEHIVTAFTDDLEHISAELMRMGGLVEAMMADACTAISNADGELAKDVVARDDAVDDLQADIERQIVRVLALRQPMARDLRDVISALKIASDLERVGDLSENIARRAKRLDGDDAPVVMKGILRMGRAVATQLRDVLDAYSAGDAEAAMRVWEGDDEIDQHYNSIFREMLTYMMEDPRLIGLSTTLLFIAKNLERIGDHCTNIAEVVHYLVTGEYPAPAPDEDVVEQS